MASGDQPTHRRSDAVRSMTRLTDAVGRLLLAGRADFSIPELASEAGVGVATAYRHVATPSEALQAYSDRAVGQLRDALSGIDRGLDPVERFRLHCTNWVAQATDWGPAVRHIRSPEGYIERLNKGDRAINGLHAMLDRVLADLVDNGLMPATDPVFAVLLWITIFDERVVYDLAEHQHWSADKIAEHLGRATANALRIDLDAGSGTRTGWD